MDQSNDALFQRRRKSRGRFKSCCRTVTSIWVHHPVGARSCWYRRRMGLGDSVLTIEHWTRSMFIIGTQSHGLMTSWNNWRAEIFQQDRFEVRLSLGTNWTLRCVEDYLQSQGGPFWMVGYAFRIHECSCHLHEANGWHLVAIHQLICSGILGWHPNLQPQLGREPPPHLIGSPNTVATQVMCQFG